MARRFDTPSLIALIGYVVGAIALAGVVWVWLQLRQEEVVAHDPAIDRTTIERTTITRDTFPPDTLTRIIVEDEVEVGPRAVRADGDITEFVQGIRAELAAEDLPTEPLREPLRVVAERVVIPTRGDRRPFLVVDRVSALVDLGAATVVRSARIVRPRVLVARRTETGPWNYERALAGLEDGDERDGEGGPVVMRDIEVVDGLVRVELPDRSFVFRDLDAFAPRIVTRPDAPGPVIDVSRLTTVTTLPEGEEETRIAVRDAQVRVGDERLGFDVGRLATADGTVVTGLEGSYAFDPGGLPGLQATGRVESLGFDLVQAYFPALPDEGRASFRFRTEPVSGGRLRIALSELSAAVQESEIAGALSVIIGGPGRPEIVSVDLQLQPLELSLVRALVDTLPLPYGGVLRGRVQGSGEALRFDLAANLTAPGVARAFDIQLEGMAGLTDDGFALRSLVAQLDQVPLAALRPVAPGLPLRGAISGTIALRGPPGEAPLDVDVALDVASGTAVVEGRLDLTGPTPAYDIEGRLIGVQIGQLVAMDVPPVSVTARFSLEGAGTDPATANAAFALRGRFMGPRAETTDTIDVRGAVRGGTLRLDEFFASLGSATIAAEGTWNLRGPGGVGIDYRLAIEDLETFAPYAPMLPDTAPVAGSLRAEGRLEGSLERPVLTGTLAGEGLQYGDWAADALTAEYTYVGREATPNVELTVVAEGVTTPTDVAFTTADLDFRIAENRFVLAFEGDRVDEGTVELAAEGRIDVEGVNSILLRNLALDVGEERWVLANTATIRWSGDSFAVENLRIQDADGAGRITLDGQIGFQAESAFEAELVQIPLGDILPLVGVARDARGILTADLRIEGPPASPEITGELVIADAVLDGVAFGRIEGDILYADQRLRADLTTLLEPGGALALDAEVPIAITLGRPPAFDLLEQAPLRIVLTADSLALAPFGRLSPLVQNVEGAVEGRVVVAGTAEAPRLEGRAALTEGAVTIPRLSQRYSSVSALLTLEDRRVVVQQLEARSGGWVRGEGTITFEELTDPVADLTFVADEFSPVGVRDMDDVQVTGTVDVTGRVFGTLVVTGEIEAEDGGVPLYAFITDETLADLERLAPPTGATAGEAAETAPLLDRIVVDGLVVRVGQGVWFVTEQVRARLAGDLTVYRDGDDVRVFGLLEGNEGTFTLEVGPLVRRLRILSATVRFFGTPDPDPAITATASRVVIGPQGRRIEVLVNVQGTISAPQLSLTTPDGTVIPESELLSVLVFGQTTVDLGTGVAGTGLVQDAFFGGIADIASMRLEETLASDLGVELDYFQIRPTPNFEGGLASTTFVVGKEITDDVFLTVETGVATLFGDWATTLEWQIDREWSLELALRPLNRRRFFLGVPLPAYSTTSDDRQISVDLTRRWTY